MLHERKKNMNKKVKVKKNQVTFCNRNIIMKKISYNILFIDYQTYRQVSNIRRTLVGK